MLRKAITALPFTAAAGANALVAYGVLTAAWSRPTLHSWSVVLFIAMRAAVFGAFAVLLCVRRPAGEAARSPLALVACAGALVAVAMIASPSARGSETSAVLAGDVVALIGGVEMVVAIAWLGRCFSVLPEARGLVTAGPYRFVRHPLYLGELTACLGLVLASPTARNVGAGAVFCVCQAVRMRLEERALLKEYPAYAEYAAVTPRVVPAPRRGARLRRPVAVTRPD